MRSIIRNCGLGVNQRSWGSGHRLQSDLPPLLLLRGESNIAVCAKEGRMATAMTAATVTGRCIFCKAAISRSAPSLLGRSPRPRSLARSCRLVINVPLIFQFLARAPKSVSRAALSKTTSPSPRRSSFSLPRTTDRRAALNLATAFSRRTIKY